MDETERARLRALCEGAAPGPWAMTEFRDGRQAEGVEELGVFAPVDPRSREKPDGTWHSAIICRGMDGPTRGANATLIVGAVNALPALLNALDAADRAAELAVAALRAEVERLRAEVEELSRSAQMACQSPPDGCDCAGCAFADEMMGGSE